MKLRHLIQIGVVLTAILLIINNTTSQWIQTNGPYGGYINCFALSGMNLFAGTSGGGVFFYTDNGTSWTAVNNGLTNPYVRALAVSGTNLFAATAGGVFLSTNNGTSWTQTGLTRSVRSLAVSGTNLFAGIYEFGVLLSTDNGTIWTEVNTGLTNSVYVLAVSDTNIFAGTNGGVFLSTNNGTNWTHIGLTNSVYVLAVSDTNIFAGTNSGVFLSTNNGTSWTHIGLTNVVYALAVSGTNLFAGTIYDGVFLSTDNGTSWISVNNGFTNPSVEALAVSGTNLFAGTTGGVFLSTDNGTSWTAVNAGITNTDVTALAVSDTNIFAGTNGGVFLSTNNGTNWTHIGLTNIVYALAVSDTNLFAGTIYDGVFLSTDNGTSWTQTSLTNTGVRALAVSGTNLFAGTINGFYRSTNNGTSWTRTGLTGSVGALAVSGTNIFAGAYGVFLSTDNGTSWTAVNNGLTNPYVEALIVSGTNLFAGTTGGVFLSTDNGTNWIEVNTGLTNRIVYALAVYETNLFAGTDHGGVFLSTNNGTSWTYIGVTRSVKALNVSGTHLFAGTNGGGVFRLPLSAQGRISGIVYDDLDRDGTMDENEPGIENWWISLTGKAEGNIQTDKNGRYIFKFLDSGEYNVKVNSKSKWFITSPEVNEYSIYLEQDSIFDNIDFGWGYPKGEISGIIFDDLDRDSTMDENEPVKEGWWVSLMGKARDSIKTDKNGRYIFQYLDSGQYSVTVNPPSGWFITYPVINQYSILFERDSVMDDLDFGWSYPRGEINGIVFDDLDSNGIMNSEDPGIKNWSVTLTGKVNEITLTDEYGKFVFDVLDSGNYVVTVACGNPRVLTYPDTNFYLLTVGFDSVINGINFGFNFPYNIVEGYVFDDQNENGRRDSNETGMPEWPVVCTSLLDNDTSRTDAYGKYKFSIGIMSYIKIVPIVPQYWEQIWPRFSQAYEYYFNNYGNHLNDINFAVHRIPSRVKLIFTVIDDMHSFIRVLRFGVRSGATYSIWGVDSSSTNIDFSEGEFEVPPILPGMFEARLIDPRIPSAGCFGLGSWTDIRDYISESQVDTYKILFQPGYVQGGNYPMTFRWEREAVEAGYAGGVFITDPYGNVTDMKLNDSLVISDSTIINLMITAGNPILTSSSVDGDMVCTISQYMLEQNYPNPFNPSTEVSFVIGHLSFVTLKVYDILGREVALLVNERKQAGEYIVTWNAENVPSGVYFYRLDAISVSDPNKTFTQVKKMILLK